MESTDLEDFTKALADIERRNGARLFYRLFPGEDTVQPGGSVTPPPKQTGVRTGMTHFVGGMSQNQFESR